MRRRDCQGALAAGIAERRTLVGREAELALLHQALDDVGEGIGGAVLVAGEPGIGKTALIGEVLSCSVERGYRTLSGRAAEFAPDVPFAVLADAAGSGWDI